MAREKAPAFQFYPKDFISDERVMRMTYTERGIYITLLSVCWLEGSIPGQPRAIAMMLKIPTARFLKLWRGPLSRCFETNSDGRLIQKRLEREREAQARYRVLQSEKGKASAQARFNRGSTEGQPALVQPEGNSSSSSSSSVSNPQKIRVVG